MLPRTELCIRAEQRGLGCHMDRVLVLCSSLCSNNTTAWLHAIHCIPRSSLQKVLPVPCSHSVTFAIPTSVHNFMHFYWTVSYFIQIRFWLCQIRSELQPRLLKCLPQTCSLFHPPGQPLDALGPTRDPHPWFISPDVMYFSIFHLSSC